MLPEGALISCMGLPVHLQRVCIRFCVQIDRKICLVKEGTSPCDGKGCILVAGYGKSIGVFAITPHSVTRSNTMDT